MAEPLLRIHWVDVSLASIDELARAADPTSSLVASEWLVTNGLGGYAAGTVSLIATSRYHGLLIAGLAAPLGRTMLLHHLGEVVGLGDERTVRLGAQTVAEVDRGLPFARCVEFRLEGGLPVWRFEAFGVALERRVLMPHRQNTVRVTYAHVGGSAEVSLHLEPWLRFRPHDGGQSSSAVDDYALTIVHDRYEVGASGYPILRMFIEAEDGVFAIDRSRSERVSYAGERARGYDPADALATVGGFRATLSPGKTVAFVASTEPWETAQALAHPAARSAEAERRDRLLSVAHPSAREGFGAHLVLAADQFIARPSGRVGDVARALAVGDEVRTIIAGYHWFADWGRDTMISLEGLTLVTGRTTEARYVLRTFAEYIRDGLIPNMFPEHQSEGIYNTADATLWFFHAIDRYLSYTGDTETLRILLPKLVAIIDRHITGTRFGIHVDSADGLLTQGAPGFALTWMDAKVGDLVVTPRRGKAVEINALFYNALRLLAGWVETERGVAAAHLYSAAAERARTSFNRRFWFEKGQYLYDVIDGEMGDDSAFRPNQILAISLRYPVLDEGRWSRVVKEVESRLLTPVGLRSLSPDHPDYKARYFGDLHARDLAYHQGTVWAWLLGPYIDAWMKVTGDRASARRLLAGLEAHLTSAGIGSISEIFDAESPFLPRGCIAQAWSVAEALRCWVDTAPDVAPLDGLDGKRSHARP
jgi:predicted glycogen debranching enzyme